MNEQQNVNTSPKPKKKRSFWWLKLLLILILFAAGVIAGIMLSSEAITQQIMQEFFPQYAVTEVAPSPVATVPAETEAPIEFKPSATIAPKPSKTPVEIVSPEAAEKAENAEKAEDKTETSPVPTEEVLSFVPITPTAEPETQTAVSGNELIGIDAALEAALNHAGLSAEEVFVYSVHRERDDGLVYYNVEFGYDGKEYEYEINAYNAKVESWQLDRIDLEDRIAASSGNGLDLSACVSVEQAKGAALAHAAYKEYEVKDLKTSLEIDNNKLIYDIEFRAEGYEYDYKVDASTGLVIMLEKERS